MNKTTQALFDPNPDVVLKALKSKHADIHAYKENWNGQEDRYDYFYQPIHVARDPRVIRALAAAGADLDAFTIGGSSNPLLRAAKINDVDAFRTLVECGAKLNVTDANENTPLHFFVEQNNAALAQQMIESGADVNARNRDKKSPLHLAISKNNEEITSRLLEAGANPNQPGKFGNVPMLYANSNAIVERLIDHGADVNKTNDHGTSPLHAFIMKGNSPAAVEVLLAAGAHVNARDEEGNTPLHYVGTNHHPDDADQLVELLVKNGADPFAINHEGAYPAHPRAHHARLAAEEKALIEQASAVRAASKPAQAFPSMSDADAYVAQKRGQEPAANEPGETVARPVSRRLV